MNPQFKDIFITGGIGQSFYGAGKRFREADARVFNKQLFMDFVRVSARCTEDNTVVATQIRVKEDYRGDEQYYLDWLIHNKRLLGISVQQLFEIEVA